MLKLLLQANGTAMTLFTLPEGFTTTGATSFHCVITDNDGSLQHGGLSIPTKGIIELVGPPVLSNHKLYASISFFTS